MLWFMLILVLGIILGNLYFVFKTRNIPMKQKDENKEQDIE